MRNILKNFAKSRVVFLPIAVAIIALHFGTNCSINGKAPTGSLIVTASQKFNGLIATIDSNIAEVYINKISDLEYLLSVRPNTFISPGEYYGKIQIEIIDHNGAKFLEQLFL